MSWKRRRGSFRRCIRSSLILTHEGDVGRTPLPTLVTHRHELCRGRVYSNIVTLARWKKFPRYCTPNLFIDEVSRVRITLAEVLCYLDRRKHTLHRNVGNTIYRLNHNYKSNLSAIQIRHMSSL